MRSGELYVLYSVIYVEASAWVQLLAASFSFSTSGYAQGTSRPRQVRIAIPLSAFYHTNNLAQDQSTSTNV